MADIDRIVGWLTDRARRSVHSAPLESRVPGDVHRSASGTCYRIESRAPVRIALPAADEAISAVLSELRLLYGIGRASAERLTEDGYGTIGDLLSHPRWSAAAQSLLEHWGDPPDLHRVYTTMSYWLPASHPLFLTLPGLAPLTRICFFDLETLGLYGSPIFLAGLGRPTSAGEIAITQYFARGMEEELGLLEAIRDELSDCLFLITYNGKAFDWTTTRARLAFYSLPSPPDPLHLDLLPHARRRFRGALPDARLETVEQGVLGIARKGDVPSEEVPRCYEDYLATGDPGPILPVIAHNRQDVETLALLYSHFLADERDR